MEGSDSEESEQPKSSRGAGRPRTSSGSARKKASQKFQRGRERLQIWLSKSVAIAFNKVKTNMNITSNPEAFKFLLDFYIGSGQSSMVAETSSSEDEQEFTVPHVPPTRFPAMMAISTPAKPGDASTSSEVFALESGMIVAPGYRPTSSISGSSTSEQRSSLRPAESNGEGNISGLENLPSESYSRLDVHDASHASTKSGIWNVDLLEDLIPVENSDSDEETHELTDMDESYFPSLPGSSDSLTLEEYEALVEEILENAVIDLEPADDEDVDIVQREEEMPDIDEEQAEPEVDLEAEVIPEGFIRIETFDQFQEDLTGIAYTACLKQLALSKHPEECRKCKGPLALEESQVGTSIHLKWVCDKHEKQHIEKHWCSQPRFKYGSHLGDFALGCSILFTGNEYAKTALLLTALNMKPVNSQLYTKIQAHYSVHAVDELWEEVLEESIEECSGRDVILLGDGRMDSPGHCAEYCTYTVVDNETKNILDIEIINKRETKLNSVIMEKEGCRRALDFCISKGLQVTEFATDAHTQIRAMMAKEYTDIYHSLDIWHGAKNLGKKLAKVAMEGGCKDLLPWVRDVINHFWTVVKKTNTFDEFVETWRGTLHHVVNKHEWLCHPTDGNLSSYMQCAHDSIETDREDKHWLTAGSKPHEKLREVVLDNRLMKDAPKYLRFRNTSVIEVFNSKILAYAPKRLTYRPPSFRARCRLAGIDYQANKDRPIALTKEGKERFARKWKKRTKRWDACPVKAKKNYSFISYLMEIALKRRLECPELIRQKVVLQDWDPRSLVPVLADVLPPPTEELVQQKATRL